MRRRQVLALAAVGLGGCLSDSSPPADTTENGTTTPAALPTDTSEGTTRRPARTTETPVPPNIESYPGDCPGDGDDTIVVCSDAAPDDAPLRMTASESTVDPPATVEFTLSNDTDARFETNHYGALLHKRVDGEWFRIAPTVVPEPLMRVGPGERHTWSVTLDHSPDQNASGGGETERHVAGLGGGRYAFGNDGWFSGESYEGSVALVTTFEIVAPPAELTTTAEVSEVTVDGDTVSARWSETTAGDDTIEATFVVRETDEQAENRILTEQVLQPHSPVRPPPLRDALTLLVEHGVSETRLTGTTSEYAPFDVREWTRFEYEGATYEMSVERTAESE